MPTTVALMSSASPSVVPCFNPATGERVGEVDVTLPHQVPAAIARSQIAQRSWAALSFKERRHHLLKLRAAFANAAEELTETIVLNTGKPRQEAVGEVFTTCDALSYFAKNAEKWLKDQRVGLRSLCNERTVIVGRGPTFKTELQWFPYSETFANTMYKVLRFLFGRG